MQIATIDSAHIRNLSSIKFTFSAIRHVGFYIWKIFIPLGLIVIMSMAVFWIDPKELGSQMTVSTASVITLIAFQFNLGYLLPRVSYLTRMDDFILGSTILVFLALAESIYTSTLGSKRKLARARKIDQWARYLFSSIFLILIIYSLWL